MIRLISKDATLRSLYLPGPVGNQTVYVEGDLHNPVVFMAHPILASSFMWDAQASVLLDQGFCVIRADARGHGKSKATATPCTMEDLVTDVLAVLDALHVERVHYIGMSLGGMTGLGLAIGHPDRVLSMCVCDVRAEASAGFARGWDEDMNLARQKGCGALANSLAERWFPNTLWRTQPSIVQSLLGMAATTSVEGFLSCASAIQLVDYLQEVGSIELPVTLIAGDYDAAMAGAMKEIQRLIPEAVFEHLPGSGYFPNVDQAAAFNEALLRHFDRVVPKIRRGRGPTAPHRSISMFGATI